ncbi:hypothetical protein TRIUR3_10203 [Triticum urartu]|uniref:AAA+ ATPase At3g28540-like C-terminal domain-containing protein n=1 Tax=Triticum urartu TaxID=4572 RepID=M8A481_TRIUA|nr:hypothetical protein TRIUR3_10203 [Triticum urartu]
MSGSSSSPPTTKDRLDPALLRPGRMDMHVHMGYCGFVAFRELAANYHGIQDHPLYPEVEALLREVEVAPAEVAERLLMTDDADAAIEMAAKLLRGRKAGTGEDGGYIKQKLHARGVDQGQGDVAEVRNAASPPHSYGPRTMETHGNTADLGPY